MSAQALEARAVGIDFPEHLGPVPVRDVQRKYRIATAPHAKQQDDLLAGGYPGIAVVAFKGQRDLRVQAIQACAAHVVPEQGVAPWQ